MLQVFVTVALIAVILIQRSEGGGLGLGGGQGMGSFMSGRGTANLLTRTTAILGTIFFILSLSLALLYKASVADNGTAAILNGPAPVSSPSVPGPSAPPPTSSSAPPPASNAAAPAMPSAPAMPPAPTAPASNAPGGTQQ